MKIGFVVDRYPEYSTTFINNQIKGLLELGHEIVVFSKKKARSYTRLNLPVSKVYYLHKCPSNTVARLFFFGVLLLKLSFFRPKAAIRYLRNRGAETSVFAPSFFINSFHLMVEDLDVAICHFGQNGAFLSRLVAKGFSIPMLTMFHGYDLREGQLKGGNIYKLLFHYGDRLLAPSIYTENLLRSFGADPEKILSLRTSVDLDLFRQVTKRIRNNKTIKILSVGRLEAIKGFDIGLEAVRILQDQVSECVEYYIVGEGSELEMLESVASKFGISEQVKFLGKKNPKEVADCMADSDVLLLCSKDETIPTVIVEAFAAGLPVVASDVGAVSEMIQEGKNGFVVSDKSPSGFASALVEVFSTPGKLSSLSEGIDNDFVDEFSVNHTVVELEAHCRTVFEEVHRSKSVKISG